MNEMKGCLSFVSKERGEVMWRNKTRSGGDERPLGSMQPVPHRSLEMGKYIQWMV